MSFLDSIKLFRVLTHEEKKHLEQFCQERNIKTGEILFSEGEEANSMYILTTGSIGVYKEVASKQVYFGTVHSEEILGEMALFYNNGSRMATAIALEDTHFVILAAFSVKSLMEHHPDLLDKIQKIIDERMTFNKTFESKLRQSQG